MPIQDPNAERRNLTVSSFFFVIFFLAEGSIKDSVLKLPMLNIEFQNTKVLVIILWITLFWFLFRYWQTVREKVSEIFIGAVERQNPPNFIETYIRKNVADIAFTEKDKLLLCYFRRSEKKWTILFRPVSSIKISSDGSIGGHGHSSIAPKAETFSQVDAPIYLVVPTLVLLSLRLFKYNSDLVSYLMPYVLFTLALFLGLLSCI